MTDALDNETFEKLLRWLDPDRNRAGEKYEKIRNRLIKILGARGCWDAEDLADQSINIVASKIDWLLENYIGDPALYFFGVAKNVFRDWVKKTPPPNLPPASPPDSTEIERLCGRLEQCLDELPSDHHVLVLRYYEGDKKERISNRKRLAQELGISQNALRIKVCHIVSRLRQLMEQCLKQLPEE
jgi:DNA-directed RNA polymerase specialized sigma24 family protein